VVGLLLNPIRREESICVVGSSGVTRLRPAACLAGPRHVGDHLLHDCYRCCSMNATVIDELRKE
jgi:hypothetical protein